MSKIKIDQARLKDVYLEKIPYKELNRHEKISYAIYLWGIMDGREITLLEALSKVDSELADEMTAKFLGDTVEGENNEIICTK